ncbi:MAG: hypothetical protein FJ333_05215 [Sphingomonadales bacterium]|nr:hypothetical protein [Sphingomonadales bacterium]
MGKGSEYMAKMHRVCFLLFDTVLLNSKGGLLKSQQITVLRDLVSMYFDFEFLICLKALFAYFNIFIYISINELWGSKMLNITHLLSEI